METRIKQIRLKHNLTQTEFGERIGIKGNTVTNYENGLRNPSNAIISSICREFNISESWLRTGEGEMEVRPPEDLVDRLAREYHLDVSGVLLVRSMARIIEELPPEASLHILEEINQDIQSFIAARQSVSDPEARVVADPQAPADDQSSLPPAGSAAR